MDGLCAGLPGGREDRFNRQVALACRRAADANGAVGQRHVEGSLVGVGIYRNRLDVELAHHVKANGIGQGQVLIDELPQVACSASLFICAHRNEP